MSHITEEYLWGQSIEDMLRDELGMTDQEVEELMEELNAPMM